LAAEARREPAAGQSEIVNLSTLSVAELDTMIDELAGPRR
jgi:hypothetical protein